MVNGNYDESWHLIIGGTENTGRVDASISILAHDVCFSRYFLQQIVKEVIRRKVRPLRAGAENV